VRFNKTPFLRFNKTHHLCASLRHTILHNKPTAEVHPGHMLTVPKEEEEEEEEDTPFVCFSKTQHFCVLQ
jgi:hypothetical protein